jgi:hypothetical protein
MGSSGFDGAEGAGFVTAAEGVRETGSCTAAREGCGDSGTSFLAITGVTGGSGAYEGGGNGTSVTDGRLGSEVVSGRGNSDLDMGAL